MRPTWPETWMSIARVIAERSYDPRLKVGAIIVSADNKEKHMYITYSPCRMCAKLIINAGIKRVVYGEAYRDPSGVKLLQGVGIRTMTLEDAVRGPR